MTEDKWKDTLVMITEKFNVLDAGEEKIEDIPNATREWIEFEGPQGKMRLEYTIKPAVLDKKTLYSKLGATAANVRYTYSDTDFVRRMQAYKWNEAADKWEEVRAPL